MCIRGAKHHSCMTVVLSLALGAVVTLNTLMFFASMRPESNCCRTPRGNAQKNIRCAPHEHTQSKK